jgi:nitrite reductase/ring-hydroxylating ferredoxin subunit
MAEFVGFTQDDAQAITESGLIIEKYLPEIVSQFYTHLLRYPPTREHFLRSDGTIDQEYLQLRMHHLTNFWRRTASGKYDDDYARYIDYVGRAHTSHGADPKIYIAERYVIGQVGFMQHAISQALTKELHEIDPDLETRALRAWNLLMMVILEMLSRAYAGEHEVELHGTVANINHQAVFHLAVETYELGLGMRMPTETKDVLVGTVQEIPEGERKIIQVDDLSIGVFHHRGGWYALRNSCLHQRGPVCTGSLKGDVLTCPWHGFQYNVTNGQFLADPSAKLASYPVQVRDGLVYLQIPVIPKEVVDLPIIEGQAVPEKEQALKKNEFDIRQVAPGHTKLVYLGNAPVAVYNVGGTFYATQSECTHANGPLEEGELDGCIITCPLHDSRFDVTTGQVLEGPADEPLKTFRVIIEGEIGRVEQR